MTPASIALRRAVLNPRGRKLQRRYPRFATTLVPLAMLQEYDTEISSLDILILILHNQEMNFKKIKSKKVIEKLFLGILVFSQIENFQKKLKISRYFQHFSICLFFEKKTQKF